MWGHGYGGAKFGFGASGSTSGMRRFTSRGYAVMSMTTRGFRESCGSAELAQTRTAARPANDGYVRLMDTRYEVRDYQDLAGLLAEDGRIEPHPDRRRRRLLRRRPLDGARPPSRTAR